MRSTLVGIVILGVAITIALVSRNNTGESAGQTFGTLGLIVVLLLVGLSFVRSGEAERVRNKRNPLNKPKVKGGKSPWASGSGPGGVPPGGKGTYPFPVGGGSSDSSETAQKLGAVVLVLAILGGGGLAVKKIFFKSDLRKLAQAESPNLVDSAEETLEAMLDKAAMRFGQDRADMDESVWLVWEANEDTLRGYDLLPSTFLREVLAAAPKNVSFEKIAQAIAKEKSAPRLARLHQTKPAPGKYPQEAEFKEVLDSLKGKTGMSLKPITGALVTNWRSVYERKKRNRKYNLMWFAKLVNSQTKQGMKQDAWLVKVAGLARAVK